MISAQKSRISILLYSILEITPYKSITLIQFHPCFRRSLQKKKNLQRIRSLPKLGSVVHHRSLYICIFIYPPPPFRFIHVVEFRELVKHPGPVKPIVEERRGVTSAFITICKGEALRAAYREEICQ